MSHILQPGQGFLFMKVGTHAKETLEDIIARKTKEIEDAGYALWGYGGNTCHPVTMVQPFAESFIKQGNTIYLCMQEMESKHFAEPIRADEFSVDGNNWEEIPEPINVLGSRYALAIKNLHRDEFDIPLSRTRVAIGNSLGRSGSRYISGRVDKACLEITDEIEIPAMPDEPTVHIGVIAELVRPYAVYVRNRR
jgi:hypothetical protein